MFLIRQYIAVIIIGAEVELEVELYLTYLPGKKSIRLREELYSSIS